MDHKILQGGFMPPAPMRIEAYLDDVTKGTLKDLTWLNLSQPDAALDLIEARATLAEKAALLSALDDRFVAFGRAQGFMKPVNPGPTRKGKV